MADTELPPTIENEILTAATALWRTGTNGSSYRCYMSEGDYDRLVAEFDEPTKLLTFTRFTVEIADKRTDSTFLSGDTAFTYLRHPPRLLELGLVPKT